MKLHHQVIYLEEQHIQKLDEVRQKLSLDSRGAAARLMIDSFDLAQVEAELAALTQLLADTIDEAQQTTVRAEQSLNRAERYFLEWAISRTKEP